MATFMIPPATDIMIGELPTPLLIPRPDRQRVAVLYQPGSRAIAEQVVGRLALEVTEVAGRELPDRERAKDLGEVGSVYEWLAVNGFGRHDTLVGVGGGALTDAAGFVASTWLRGIESVLIPTTLLGAVDAAIGGKTGINVAGKNLVGSFWAPSRVLIDPSSFDTLSPALRREGLAEALKCAYLADGTLLRMIRSHGESVDLAEVVERAVRVKVEVVRDDPREQGRRAVLNYGHTVGHAIEYLSELSHGEAVGIGMVAAATVSRRRLGFDAVDEHIGTIGSLGLPVTSPALSAEQVIDLIRRDKKRSAAGVRMILLREYGDPVIEVVDEADLQAGLSAVGIT